MTLNDISSLDWKGFSALLRRRVRGVSGRRLILLMMQLALCALLFGILVLIVTVNTGQRLFTYAALVVSLSAVLLYALRLNLKGRYKLAAWITMIDMVLAPWISVIMDPEILRGDVIPLTYIVLSIQLCATFLNEWLTAAIALVQLISVSILLAVNPGFADLNWPSFCAYIICATAIGITTSFITRKHMEQIEAQNDALRASEERLRILSTRDPLTGQYNRRYMEETLEREISRVLRKGLPLGLMIADMNNFKEINDTQGHLAGDAVLCGIAEILSASARKSDVVCRFGGDEFVLIFPECTRETVEARRDEIIRALAAKPLTCMGKDLGCATMSFGIASLPEDGTTAEALFNAADTALYAAKRLSPRPSPVKKTSPPAAAAWRA